MRESLELASVMKMNDVEVPQVLNLLGLEHASGTADLLRSGAERLLVEFDQLKLVAITCGGEGTFAGAALELGSPSWPAGLR